MASQLSQQDPIADLHAGADRSGALPDGDAASAAMPHRYADRNGRGRVLIVDDDASQALFAQVVLRHAGMETLIADDASSAFDGLDRFRPDVLLLDLNLPGCDGLQLAGRIRHDHAGVAIVFLSGEPDVARQSAALALGAALLVKPIQPVRLATVVIGCMSSTHAATDH